MCGIAGCVLGRGASPDVDRLGAMRDALAHRGPDDCDVQVVENVGLVHTRLSIVDLSRRGHQPMRHPGGGWWLAYNGEIYNHRALRRELTGAAFVGDSDTETLLWALERWGLEVLPRLTGQFAFAALDLAERRLLLCRDRFGIKPLYVARGDGAVWFASEPAALLAAGVPPTPVEHAWEEILAGSYLGGELTLIEGITRVAPGSWIAVSLDEGTVSARRWHAASAGVNAVRAAALARLRRPELTSVLEGTLRHAVHGALLSDAKVGTLCSGGVDSSLITALAAEVKPDLVAFGASCRTDGALDEGPAAQRVAGKLGIDLELVEVTPESFRQRFVAATVHAGWPLANGSAVSVAQLAERAHRGGVKVLLTGEGADELFGGYGNLHAAALSAFLPRRARVMHVTESLLTQPRHLLNPESLLRGGWHLARAILALPSRSAWMPLSMPSSGHDPAPEALDAYGHHAGKRRTLEAALLTRLDYTLCWLLNRMDKNVMQASVEARVPFLEPEVVELALNLPLEARVGPWSKGILRDVARRVLPWWVAYRPKIYGMDFLAAGWIQAAADPRFVHDGLLRDTLRIPHAQFGAVLDGTNVLQTFRLWSTEIWCRSIAGHPIPQIEQAIWR